MEILYIVMEVSAAVILASLAVFVVVSLGYLLYELIMWG